MTDEQIEAWLDERAEARVKVSQRSHGVRRRHVHRARAPAGGIGDSAGDAEGGIKRARDRMGRTIEESVTRHSGAVARHCR